MKKIDVAWIYTLLIKVIPPFLIVCYLVYLVYRFLYYPVEVRAADFTHYWVASLQARTGEAAAVYDFSRLREFGQAVAGISLGIPWFNTPTFLMFLLPFSLLPYLPAMFLWILLTLGGYLLIIYRLAPHRLTPWVALGFPATLLNICYGQNGFLSAIFFGGGLLLLDRSPIAAGILLGLLTYKPQLAVLVPIGLAVSRRWQSLMVMLVTGIGLISVSAILFGLTVWEVFLTRGLVLLGSLKTGQISAVTTLSLSKMTSVVAAMKFIGAGSVTAAVVQLIVGLAVIVIVAWVWRSGASLPVSASVLVLGTFLITPYSFVYDYVIIAIPLAYLGWQGYQQGWIKGEIFCLMLAWIAPLYAGFNNCTLLLVPIILLMFIAIRRLKYQGQY